MFATQGTEHRSVVRGMENALKDDVIAFVECVARDGVDQADVDTARDILFAEQVTPDDILADDRDTSAAPKASFPGDRGFARTRIAAQNHERCQFTADLSHGCRLPQPDP